jgi:5-methylcytosine-specific restriction enzyme A
MLKSCSYCGGVHDRNHQCSSKPKRTKKVTHVDRFRWTKVWQRKRKHINKRDKHLCQVCIRERHNTQLKYNFTNIEVHHIVPIVVDWDRRLDDDNLICLCSFHHHMAEHGEISSEELIDIVNEQERLNAF